MTTLAPKMTALDTTIAELTSRLQQALDRATRLEHKVAETERRVAAGTLPPPISETPAPPIESLRRRRKRSTFSPPAPTPPKGAADALAAVEAELEKTPAGTASIASATALPVGQVVAALRDLRRAGRVVNVGDDLERPVWSLLIGDETPTSDLMTAVERLIRIRPMGLHELAAATGARVNRISGVLVKLARVLPVKNRGTRRRALWSL